MWAEERQQVLRGMTQAGFERGSYTSMPKRRLGGSTARGSRGVTVDHEFCWQRTVHKTNRLQRGKD